MDYKPGIIIQARRGSTRFSDKIVRPFYKEKSILELLIDRYSNINDLKLVVATTEEPEDQRICEICEESQVPYLRGPGQNVMRRFYLASTKFKIDPIIRVCSDNPFLLKSSPTELLNSFISKKADYIGYNLSGNRIGIRTHFGLWAELLTRDSLSKALSQANEKHYLEHVTSFLYEKNNEFSNAYIDAPEIVFSRDDIRLTIDTESDFNLVRDIYDQYFEMNKELELGKLIRFIDSNSEWIRQMTKSIRENEK